MSTKHPGYLPFSDELIGRLFRCDNQLSPMSFDGFCYRTEHKYQPMPSVYVMYMGRNPGFPLGFPYLIFLCGDSFFGCLDHCYNLTQSPIVFEELDGNGETTGRIFCGVV